MKCDSLPVKSKSSCSGALREISLVTFDVADESCEGNAAPHPGESYRRSESPEAVGRHVDQQRETEQTQEAEEETKTIIVGEEDAAEDKEEDKTRVEVEGNEKTHKTEEIESEDQSGRPASGTSDREAELVKKEDEGDRDTDDDDDVDVEIENPEEAEQQAELSDEMVATTNGVTELDNAEQPCSADPDVDPCSVQRKHPEVLERREERARRADNRSVRNLQTSGRGTGTPSQRDQDLQKENLHLASENLELRFQLEQANKDLPRLKVNKTS
ncbi:centrosomal protein of 290 kDa-like isoform X2 [Notothenia coriiceps]|uniref:Centrosomal protein of 290 kDa-like isoform X2 n=1 Tax=Notothenia coriiceps TaxID=8208 RepID=A0A6I9MQP2_9TELE|nr:PREDICTED: centrosomal protein of 290 kDa-like isoform X2 [Notothenia coriiceps]